MNNLFTAIRIANEVHNGQIDKGGSPYIFHPFRIAIQIQSDYHSDSLCSDLVIVAILHDCIEDAEDIAVTRLNIYRNFTIRVASAVDAITREENCSWKDYLENVKQNYLSTIVKIYDLEDNSLLSRLNKNPNKKDYLRREKYLKAIKFLES